MVEIFCRFLLVEYRLPLSFTLMKTLSPVFFVLIVTQGRIGVTAFQRLAPLAQQLLFVSAEQHKKHY
jgi:hypothetical protein